MGAKDAILNASPMDMETTKTSKLRDAGPVSVSIGDTLNTSPGSAALSGLEKGSDVEQLTNAKSYLLSAADARDSAPVASVDNTPSSLSELGHQLCTWGHISMDALYDTLERVKAVCRE